MIILLLRCSLQRTRINSAAVQVGISSFLLVLSAGSNDKVHVSVNIKANDLLTERLGKIARLQVEAQ